MSRMPDEQPGTRPPQSEALISPGDAAVGAVTVMAKGAASFAKAHPKMSSTYLLGITLMALGTGFGVSTQMRTEYDDGMQEIDASFSEDLATTQRRWAQAENVYRNSQGFFWSCDAKCQHAKRGAEEARRAHEAVGARERAAVANVKSKVGVMSVYGVQEARDLFWGIFAGGKDFAKRQSMWDMVFMAFRTMKRDENMLSVLAKWVMQLLFNFTLGLCGALVVFIAKLWGLISSYQTDPITGFAFWLLAAISAGSFVLTYLLAMYGTAAAGVTAVASAAAAQQRIEAQGGGRGGGRPRYVEGGRPMPGMRHPHYQ